MAKRLSLEETNDCLTLWRNYGSEEAAELLITSNRGLVRYFAKKHMGKGIEFEELESIGLEALWRAINKFDFENRAIEGFSTYIATAIENSMKREIKVNNKHANVLSLNQPLGNSKDGDELRIEDILGSEPEKLTDEVIDDMKSDIVKKALKCLTTRERQIILLRYGVGEDEAKTLDELAEIFNCTKTTIANQEKKALIKMRHPRNTRKLKDFVD